MGLFEKMAEKMKNSNSVVLLFIVFGVGLWIGGTLWMEDYRTTYEGYKALPTLKTTELSLVAVALFPQVGQIIFFYYYMQDTNRRWALMITAVLAFTDWFTDVYYKSAAGTAKFSIETLAIAGGESFVIYELGSELLLAVCLGVLFELGKPAVKRIAYWMFPALKEQEKKKEGEQKGNEQKGNGGGGNNQQHQQKGNNNQQHNNNHQQQHKGNNQQGGGNPQKQQQNSPNGQGKGGPFVLNPEEIRRIMEDK